MVRGVPCVHQTVQGFGSVSFDGNFVQVLMGSSRRADAMERPFVTLKTPMATSTSPSPSPSAPPSPATGPSPARNAVVASRIADFMLRTSQTPLRPVWALAHSVVMRMVASYVRMGERRASVFVKGSFASGDPLYGVSDIDLVVVAPDDPDGRNRERMKERWQKLGRRIPSLQLLIPHFWVYESNELIEASSAPSLTYGLNGRKAPTSAFLRQRPIADDLGLQDRPGLYAPKADWRRLAGPERRPPASQTDEQDRRLTAWLELQYWWRYVFKATAMPGARHVPYLCVKFLAEPVRILAWLTRGERIATRIEALRRGVDEFPDEAAAFRLAIELNRALPRSPTPQLEAVIPPLVRLSRKISSYLSAAMDAAGHREVRLVPWDEREFVLGPDARKRFAHWTVGAPAGPPRPLADWRARAAPELPDETFAPVVGDATIPEILAAASRDSHEGVFPLLAIDDLFLLPTLRWERGTGRAIQSRVTDPVTMALLSRETVARFPELNGWSARDSALRAVAEHRGWLEARSTLNETARRSLGRLLTAARAALFLESLDAGDPELVLSVAAVAHHLEQSRGARGLALDAYEAFRDSREHGKEIPPDLVAAFERYVRTLPALGAEPSR